ncbi:MAG: hypothetical protein M9916_12860 [Crocinitomicaceae bacterium]|nr:hypothetical protein [Crocinitomicaceae bacterium]
MTKLKRVIGESGGTKTDWLLIDENNQQKEFTTVSYHPIYVNDKFISEQREFWGDYDLSNCILDFYGSGCLKEEKQELMKNAFCQIGFGSAIDVKSDIHAAYLAVNDEEGMIAICGTGSVLFKIENQQLVEIRGGLGWEKGDEGSGFYFGKLIVQAIKQERKYPEIVEAIEKWMPLEELFSIEHLEASKSIYSQLPKVLSSFENHPFVVSTHLKNVQLFLDNYAKGVTKISFVGGYAHHFQTFFRLACNERNIEIGVFVKRPMDALVK